ncbi:MAG: hypothetical protein PHT04_08025, partial [Eubacteriales bacterium]|nr:hypothetical protein [Eubacteriales bacterium]
MKKIISVFLVILLILSLAHPLLAEQSNIKATVPDFSLLNFTNFSKTAGFHFNFTPASAAWKQIVGVQSPAKLNATYTLKENVIQVSPDFDKNIRSASDLTLGGSKALTPTMRVVSNGAFIKRSILEQAVGTNQTIQPDTVFVNTATGTAFKVVVAMDGTEGFENLQEHYAVTRPQIHEVVDDLNIPASDVLLNKANVTSFAGLPAGHGGSVEQYIVNSNPVMQTAARASEVAFRNLENPLIQFEFPEGTELQAKSGGQNITVRVSGGIGVGDLGLEAKYSGFSGYYFALKIAQEAYLNVDVGVNITQEIRIPILGIDVPFGIGRVSGGLFVVVGLDGKVTIQMEAREYLQGKAGVKGDTFLYAPVSCKPFVSIPERYFSGDVQVDGQINGFVKAGALLSLEIFGWDLVGAGVFIGSGVNITSVDGLLDIELYGLVQVYITFIGETYYLVHLKPTLLRKQQKDMGGYRVTLEESCAYQDIVVGFLQKSVTQGGEIALVNAADARFRMVVTNPLTNQETTYPANYDFYSTDHEGRFLVHDPDLDLKVSDLVAIKVYVAYVQQGKQMYDIYGPSKPIASTYPFRYIRLTAADAFNDWIEGQVEPARVRNWDKQPGEEDHKTLFFQGDVEIDVQLENNQNGLRQRLYTVHVTSGPDGAFRAYNGGLKAEDPPLDVRNEHRFTVSIDQDSALCSLKSYVSPHTQFALKTVTETVPGTSTRFMEGADTVDQVKSRTRIYVINMGGSRQLTNIPANVTLHGLSTQDRCTNGYWAGNIHGEMQYYGTGDGKTVNNATRDLVFQSSSSIAIENSSSIGLVNDQTNGTSFVDLMPGVYKLTIEATTDKKDPLIVDPDSMLPDLKKIYAED